MKEKLIIVTGNPLKFSQLSHELNNYFDCEQAELEGYHEIQGTPEKIILHKLMAAYEHFKNPVLVDDTSLHFDELNGFPGPYIKDFISHLPIYDMGVKFVGSRVQITSRLGLYNGVNEAIIAEGTVKGQVVMPKNIDPGVRQFELFVQLDGTDRPMIEYDRQEVNKYSHRGNALKDLINKLNILKNK
jgi:non-canonical purine NTP pyrophosphatase (RdgB/HAM1 family)